MSGLSGGRALVRALAAHGVDQVFGIPGTHNLEIYSWLGEYGVGHVTPRHEQGAGYAADGYARTTGRPGVVITTTGPAVLNAAAAAGQAYSDSVPVLLVSPGMPLRHPATATGLLHETKDQSRALDAVVAWSHRVTSVVEVEAAVAQAFTYFAAGRPRPVHLEIPLDVILETAELPARPLVAPVLPERTVPAALIAEAACWLSGQVAIVAGGGARRAAAEVRALAEALGAPVVTTANGKGVLPESHPLSLGVGLHLPAVQEWLAAAGTVLAIGTELAESDFWCPPPAFPRLLRIDVDPAQRGDLTLVGDAAPTVRALLAALPPTAGTGITRVRERRGAQARAQGRRWLPWLAAIRSALDPDAILTSDSAMACYYGALPNLPVEAPGHYLHPTGYGTLGYALPAAIGAKVAAPDRQVVALSGDGGLQFTVNELATAADLGLPLPVVVFDNGGYGEIRAEMLARGDTPLAVDVAGPDLALLARAYHGEGVVVAHPDELSKALEDALDRPRPTVIAVPEESP